MPCRYGSSTGLELRDREVSGDGPALGFEARSVDADGAKEKGDTVHIPSRAG